MTPRLWSWLTDVFATKPSQMPARRPVSARPSIEVLEDRTVPSATTPIVIVHPPIVGPVWPIPIPTHGLAITGSVTSFPVVDPPIPIRPLDAIIFPRPYVSPHFELNLVILKDGKVDTHFRGTVQIVPSGVGDITGLPSTYTFTAHDAGRHSFAGYAPKPGSYSIQVTDASHPKITHTFTFTVGYSRIVPLASS